MRGLHATFDDRLYVELQRHPGEEGAPEAERLTERGFVEMAYDIGLPLVATNDVYFPNAAMYEAHDAMICVAEGAYVDQSQAKATPDQPALPEIAAGNGKRFLRTCQRRLKTQWKLRNDALLEPTAVIRSYRNLLMTRWKNCVVRQKPG